MSDDLMVKIGYQVQSTADWRREKAEQYPDDKRNLNAAQELDRLAIQIEAAEDSQLHRQIKQAQDSLNRLPNREATDCWEKVQETINAELKAIGFHTSYSTGVELLEWYRDLLYEKYHDQIEKVVPAPSLDEEVANDPAVAAAERAYQEAYAKALTEIRKRL